MKSKTIEEYMALPYSVEITPQIEDDGTTYFARVVELPGCMTEVDSFEEVEEMIHDAMQGWLEVAMEIGKKIPEPKLVEQYSGKFVLRLPKSLHRDATRAAHREAVSLNQYIVAIISKEVGRVEDKERLAFAIDAPHIEKELVYS